MHARYYHLNIARFLSIDPIRSDPKNPQSLNLFGYVKNNPINVVDPDGRRNKIDDISASVGDPLEGWIDREGFTHGAAAAVGLAILGYVPLDRSFSDDAAGGGGGSLQTTEVDYAELLAQLTYAEGGGEGALGMALVAFVAKNRVQSTKFPNTYPDVIFQKGAFEAVGKGRWIAFSDPATANPRERAAMELARSVALDVICGRRHDPIEALYFSSRRNGQIPSFFVGRLASGEIEYLLRFGKHDFWR